MSSGNGPGSSPDGFWARWRLRLAVAGPIATILAFIVVLLTFLGVRSGGGTTSSAPSAGVSGPASGPTSGPVPGTTSPAAPSVSPTPSLDPSPSPTPSASPSPAFNPGILNSSSTDTTPFALTALLPASFTDANGVQYVRVAGGPHPCTGGAYVSSSAQAVLRQLGCSEEMIGVYLLSNSDSAGDLPVMVSVQVFPLAGVGTAMQAYDEINSEGASLGVWCPALGGICGNSQGYAAAEKQGWRGYDHRYFVAALAIPVNLSTDPALQGVLSATAQEAFDDAGPEIYWGPSAG